MRAILREATRRRIRAERAALSEASKPLQGPRSLFNYNRHALKEPRALELLKDVPSVFYFAEQVAKERGTRYFRPEWAAQRYGAR